MLRFYGINNKVIKAMRQSEKTPLFNVESAGPEETKREIDTPLFRENPATFSKNFMASEREEPSPEKDTIVHL